MPDDDVDRPAAELNALAPTGPSPTGKLARIVGWLERLVEMRGSDLLLVAGLPPSIIRDGAVTHDRWMQSSPARMSRMPSCRRFATFEESLARLVKDGSDRS